jgi:hypothetical protein
MSRVESLLGLALLSLVAATGCAVQAGDPSAEETNKPAEVAEPGAASGATEGAHPDTATVFEHGDLVPVEPAAPGAPPPSTSQQLHPESAGSQDNPNPSPWVRKQPPPGVVWSIGENTIVSGEKKP